MLRDILGRFLEHESDTEQAPVELGYVQNGNKLISFKSYIIMPILLNAIYNLSLLMPIDYN